MLLYLTITDCLEDAKNYLYSHHLNKPIFINTENRQDYCEIKDSLEAMANKKLVSSYCRNKDANPDLSCLMEELNNTNGNILLIGFTSYLQLQGEVDFVKKLRILCNTEYHCKLVVLCYQSEKYLRELWEKDHRLNRQIFFVKGEADVKPSITFFVNQRNSATNNLLDGLQSLLQSLESNTITSIQVKTKKRKSQYANSLLVIKEISSSYDAIAYIDKTFINSFSENFGTEEQWSWLLDKLSEGQSLNTVFKKQLGTSSNLELIFDNWNKFDSMQQWLYWLGLKNINNLQNQYLQIVMQKTDTLLDFEQCLFRTLLDISFNEPNFITLYSQRKLLLQTFKSNNNLVMDYCDYSNIKGTDRLFYLTDNTQYEREQIITCLSTHDYPQKYLEKYLHLIYPDLALYFSPYWFNQPLLDGYFEKYKRLKVKNKISDEFLRLVTENATKREYNKEIPLRSEKTESISKQGAFTYFVDALGVEFLAYIMEKCKQYEMFANVTVCRSNLPSITSANKEFIQEFDDKHFVSIKDLDKVKHDGIYDFDYQKTKLPIHITKELSIIDDILKRAQEKLLSKNYNKVILISDHGASRFAVTNAKKLDGLEIDMKGEYSGRCCKLNEYEVRPEIEYATEEQGYYVLADYSRFMGSRAASVEAHGGATLEEIVVPIIELSLLDNTAYEVRFTSDVITISFRMKASIKLFSTTKLSDVTLKVNNSIYIGESTDGHNFIFEMEDIKQTGDYSASVYSKNNLISEGLTFKVEKAGSKEKDLF